MRRRPGGAPDRIFLRGIRFSCTIGVPDRERRRRQPVSVDLDLEVELAEAAASDDIRRTVDYGVLARRVAALGRASRCYLIEALAERICAECLRFPGVRSVSATVYKRRRRGTYRRAGVAIQRTGRS